MRFLSFFISGNSESKQTCFWFDTSRALLTHFGLHKVDFMKPFVKHQVKKKDRVDLFLVGLGVCQRIFDAWNAACKFSPLFDSRGLFASHTSGCQVLINAIFNSGRNASSYHWQNLPSLSQTLVIFLELKWRSSAWQLIMPSEDASAAPTQR